MAQVVLITGASSGIGRVTAEYLARRGYRVFGASLDPDIPVAGAQTLLIDIRDPDSVQAGVQEVLRQAGQIDILINNAGILGAVGGPEEISRAQWQRVLETNVLGMIEMTQAVVPNMRERCSGLIINMSSIVGLFALPYYFGPYITSKHAIEGYTEVLRGDLKPFGIRVAAINPSIINTGINTSIEQPAHPVADYAPYRERAQAMQIYGLTHGRAPELVAEAVESVILNPDPPLHTPAGREAQILLPLARPIPHQYPERVLHWLALRSEPWQPEREPIRRLFMDTQYADDVQRKSLWALALIALLLFIGWVKKR